MSTTETKTTPRHRRQKDTVTMPTPCPHCDAPIDDAAILSAAGRINAARRKTRGHATQEQLREAGRKGVEARRRKRASS